jgi:predicted amidohydrolase YtcJ
VTGPVDRAWVNGRVFTGSAFAEGFLVEGGEVRAVGPDDAVRRARGTGSDVVDLRGRLVVPGLIDLHMHLTDTVLQRSGVDLRGTRSREELASRIRARLTPGSTGPIIGIGWDSSGWGDPREPTRDELDRISSERPLILFQVSMHAAALNSAALEAVGADDQVIDPPGGLFGRDSRGRLNGLVVDSALATLNASGASREWSQANLDAYEELLRESASLGLTTLCPVLATADEITTVARLTEGAVPVRLRFYLDLRELDQFQRLPNPTAESRWAVIGVKAITDGAFGTRSAWLAEPYSDRPETTGFPIWRDEELAAALTVAWEFNLQPALHAIGDRALKRVLEVLEKANSRGIPRIEHASLTPPSLWTRLEKLRPHLVVEPHFVETDRWVIERLGADRAKWTYAYRTLTDRGFDLGGASDSPVEPLDPWSGLRAAVHRAPRSAFGQFSASERLAPIEAFQLYTRNAGPILGEPGLGKLSVGSPADFVVTSATSLDGALGGSRPPVVETWVGGRRSFPAASS